MVALVDAQDVLLPHREISLHVRAGPLRGAFFPTSWCDLLLLGRAPSNHLMLPHEMVSAHHCLLVRQRPGIKFQVLDARSRQGTWVNGQRVAKAVVGLGDQLAIGPFELEFVDTVSVQRPPYDLRPAASRPPVFAIAPWKRPGEPVVLPSASATVVGCDRLAHLRVKDPSVSDFHCLIATHPVEDGRAPVLIDLRSEGGTFVKRMPVHRKRIRPKHIITVGRSHFVLCRTADVRPAAPIARAAAAPPLPGLPVR